MWRECTGPKVGAPKEAENVGLIQRGVAVRRDHFGVHLRVLGPMHVAVHVVDCVVPVVAGEPVNHRAGEVASGVHVHLWPFVLSKDYILCSIMLKHIPEVFACVQRIRWAVGTKAIRYLKQNKNDDRLASLLLLCRWIAWSGCTDSVRPIPLQARRMVTIASAPKMYGMIQQARALCQSRYLEVVL